MALNTSAFVPGQPSTIRVDGIVTAGGTATAISASGITLRFDSSKVTLSNLHGDATQSWAVVASNTDHMADGWVKVAKTVLLAAANPVKVRAGMMKRAHSVAQGRKGGNSYRRTGSHVYNAAFSDGKLRDATGQWVTWTDIFTQDQGAYPWPSSIVTWTIPDGHEYYTENGIGIQL